MPKYLFPKAQLDKSPRMSNLAAAPAAQKAEAQRVLSPVMDVLTTLASLPMSAATSALTYSPESEAAFITPRAGAKVLKKFADATLEHLPNPKNLKFDDVTSSMLHDIYGKSPEGKAILDATGIPNIPVIMDEAMAPTSRGAMIRDSISGKPKEIRVNAFPLAGEYDPSKTLVHEVQHLIDTVQGRIAGTNLTDTKSITSALKAKDIEANLDEASTISKKTLDDIMNQSELDTYLRHAGENRARIDAGQFPQFENFATWFEDALTGKFTTGR